MNDLSSFTLKTYCEEGLFIMLLVVLSQKILTFLASFFLRLSLLISTFFMPFLFMHQKDSQR